MTCVNLNCTLFPLLTIIQDCLLPPKHKLNYCKILQSEHFAPASVPTTCALLSSCVHIFFLNVLEWLQYTFFLPPSHILRFAFLKKKGKQEFHSYIAFRNGIQVNKYLLSELHYCILLYLHNIVQVFSIIFALSSDKMLILIKNILSFRHLGSVEVIRTQSIASQHSTIEKYFITYI